MWFKNELRMGKEGKDQNPIPVKSLFGKYRGEFLGQVSQSANHQGSLFLRKKINGQTIGIVELAGEKERTEK